MIPLSVISVDAGKSYITHNMLKSLLALGLDVDIIILCNHKNEYLDTLQEFNKSVKFIYDFDLVKNIFDMHKQHMVSVIKLLNYVKTDFVFLCDNDVIFTEKFKSYLDLYYNYDIIAQLENMDHLIKYFVKDIWMYDNKITAPNEDASNIYVNNPYYNNLKLYSNSNNIYVYKSIDNFYIKALQRFLPYHIFFNYSKIKKYPLFDNKFECGYSVDKRSIFDSFSTITYNAIKNHLNILYTDFSAAVKHIRSATWYRSRTQYDNRLKELNLLPQ